MCVCLRTPAKFIIFGLLTYTGSRITWGNMQLDQIVPSRHSMIHLGILLTLTDMYTYTCICADTKLLCLGADHDQNRSKDPMLGNH